MCNKFVMPDFANWAEHCVASSDGLDVTLINLIEQALQQSFDQGRALGNREGFKSGLKDHTDKWWQKIDKDSEEQKEDEEVLAALVDSNHPDVVQYLDMASGCFVAFNRKTKKEIGRNCGGKPFEGLTIINYV